MSDELINKVKFQKRDCEHGRQVGKCETCDLFEAYNDIEQLREQLAKANERVKELEKESLAFRSILDQSNRFHPNTDKMYSSGFKDAMRLFEDIYLGGAQQALNKFALEKKLKALDDLLEEIECSVVVPKRYEQLQEPYLEGIKHCIQFIECQSEQLRKEQE